MCDELAFLCNDILDSFNIYNISKDMTVKDLPKFDRFVGYSFNNILKYGISFNRNNKHKQYKDLVRYFD